MMTEWCDRNRRRTPRLCRIAALVGILFVGACAEKAAEPGADTIATFRGGVSGDGNIELADVESRLPTTRTENCRAVRRARGSAGVDTLIPCYRDIARSLALEELIAASVDDLDQRLVDLGDAYLSLRNEAYLAPFRNEMLREIEVTDEEVDEYFASHRDDYRQPARITLWNIFRRHESPDRHEETLTFLAGLKAEYEAGRPFDHLAREHSQSETRLRGGLVGSVAEGDLPKALEKVAFALEEGEVSDPILVRGGAVLLQARNRFPGTPASLDAVEDRVRRDLVQQRLKQAMAVKASSYQPTDADLVLDEQRLVAEMNAALDAGDNGRVVLALGDARLDAAGLRRAAGLPADRHIEESEESDDPARADLLAAYEDQLRYLAVAAELMATADDETRDRAEDMIRTRALPLLVDQVLGDDMASAVDSDPEALRQYFVDQRAHYQSALRFDLKTWDLPFADDPPEQLRQMEELQRQLVAGTIDLQDAADVLGGTIRDLGWLTYDQLTSELPNKAQEYLLAGSDSYSVPFQQDDALHVILIEDRREPGPVEYEEVAAQVRADYLERFERQLFEDAAERRLEPANFTFREKLLRDLLAPDAVSENTSP